MYSVECSECVVVTRPPPARRPPSVRCSQPEAVRPHCFPAPGIRQLHCHRQWQKLWLQALLLQALLLLLLLLLRGTALGPEAAAPRCTAATPRRRLLHMWLWPTIFRRPTLESPAPFRGKCLHSTTKGRQRAGTA